MNETTPLARPNWNHEDYFREKFEDVTILICQRNTRDLIQLCVSSILQHYPEIKILVVDGNSQDESISWLHFMAAMHPNIKVWERVGRNSHGETMHEAIQKFIKTKYVLLMDSDTIVRRGGFIEKMLEQFYDDEKLFATGSLMLVTRSGEGCGDPKNDNDVLRYAHPSCSLYDVDFYKRLNAPFHDHGAPCIAAMIAAEHSHFNIEGFPVEKYVQHLCGASWQQIPTVWNDDADIQIRPLVTFICDYDDSDEDIIATQTDADFNMVMIDKKITGQISTYDRGTKYTHEQLFDIRFKVNGYYVCDVRGEVNVQPDFIKTFREFAMAHPNKNELTFQGIKIFKRKYWQQYVTIK